MEENAHKRTALRYAMLNLANCYFVEGREWRGL